MDYLARQVKFDMDINHEDACKSICIIDKCCLVGWRLFFKITDYRQCKNINLSLQHKIYLLALTYLFFINFIINKTNERIAI
jgi:hypothetical protein